MNLAKYVVSLEAQSRQYVAELQKANKTLGSFHKQQTNALDNIKKGLIGLGAAFSVRMVAGFVRGQIEAADETLALSKRLGVTTEALSELQYAAKLSNVDFQTLTMSMQFLAKNVSAAAANTGGAQTALASLHLEAKKLTDLPLDKQLEVVSGALAGVKNHSDQVRLALALFGKSGAAVLQMAGDIATLRAEAARLGITLTEDMAVRGDMAADALDRLGFMLKAVGRDAALAIAPLIVGLTDVEGSFGGMLPTFDKWVTRLAQGLGFIEDAWRGWELLIKGTKMVVLDFETVAIQVAAKVARGWTTMTQELAKTYLALLKFGDKLDPLGIGKMFGANSGRDAVEGFFQSIITGTAPAADALDELAASLGQTADEARTEFEALAALPMPGLAITEGLEAARAKIDEQTKALAKARADAAAAAAADAAAKDDKINMKGLRMMGEGPDLTQLTDAFAALDELRSQDLVKAAEYHRKQREMYAEQAMLAQQFADVELDARTRVFDGAVGLLQALGAEHRGAAIAALVLQKAMAIKELMVNAATSKALIVQNTAVAVMKAIAVLGPIAGAAASGAIMAKGAAAIAAVTTSTAISAGLIVAEGVIEATQLSKRGTEATRGTTANPIAVTGGGAVAGTSVASSAASTRDRAVSITLTGDFYGWDDYTRRKIIDALKSAVNDHDVVFINANSRQGLNLGRP